MRTTHLSTVHVFVATTWCQYWWEGRSSSEQISSNGHHMSIAMVEGARSHAWYLGDMVPMSQCIMGNCHIGTPVPWTEWQTDINFPQLLFVIGKNAGRCHHPRNLGQALRWLYELPMNNMCVMWQNVPILNMKYDVASVLTSVDSTLSRYMFSLSETLFSMLDLEWIFETSTNYAFHSAGRAHFWLVRR